MRERSSIGTFGTFGAFLAVLTVLAVAVAFPRDSRAGGRWTGRFFLDGTRVTQPETSSDLFRTGLSLGVLTPTKYGIDFRLNFQLDYAIANGKDTFSALPLGNLAVDLSTDTYTLTLQHFRSVSITTQAELVQNATSRVAFSLMPQRGPRLQTTLSRLENLPQDRASTIRDLFSIFADYRWRWLSLRSGYNYQRRRSAEARNDSSNFQIGAGINWRLFSHTSFVGDFDFNRYATETRLGFRSSTTSRATRLGLNSRPSQYVGVDANFSRDDIDSGPTSVGDVRSRSEIVNLTGTLYPLRGLRLWATLGNRSFDDAFTLTDVDYTTLAGQWFLPFSPTLRMDLLASRTDERDRLRGDNLRDAFVSNINLDIIRTVSMRFNLNVTRNTVPGFVDTQVFDASGILAERVLYDDRPAGFTFFDTENSDLYKKNSANFGDWSAPQRIEPVSTRPYFVNRVVQANMLLTPKTTLVVSYGGVSTTDRLDLTGIEGYTTRGTLTCRPNRRTGYSLTGTASRPEFGADSDSWIGTMTVRSLRGHLFNLSLGRRDLGGLIDDTLTCNIRMNLRRRSSIELTYSSSQFLEDEQRDFFRIRYSRSFR